MRKQTGHVFLPYAGGCFLKALSEGIYGVTYPLPPPYLPRISICVECDSGLGIEPETPWSGGVGENFLDFS